MLGLTNIIMGLLISVLTGGFIALSLTVLSFEFTPVGVVLVGSGLAFGLGLSGYGIFQMLRQPAGKELARIDARLIFRAMIGIVGLDGTLQPDEIEAIRRYCRELFGREMDEAAIRKAFNHAQTASFGGFAFEGVEQRASPDARTWALKAAALVAWSNGEISDAQQRKLLALGGLLGLSPDIQKRCMHEVQEMQASV